MANAPRGSVPQDMGEAMDRICGQLASRPGAKRLAACLESYRAALAAGDPDAAAASLGRFADAAAEALGGGETLARSAQDSLPDAPLAPLFDAALEAEPASARHALHAGLCRLIEGDEAAAKGRLARASRIARTPPVDRETLRLAQLVLLRRLPLAEKG